MSFISFLADNDDDHNKYKENPFNLNDSSKKVSLVFNYKNSILHYTNNTARNVTHEIRKHRKINDNHELRGAA